MPRRRLLELGVAAGLGLAALTARLVKLQLIDGEAHRSRAENNRMRVSRVPAVRGLIYDRHRIPMARNRPSFTVSILPADLPDRSDVVLQRLARLVGGSAVEFQRKLTKHQGDPFRRIPLKTTPDPKVAHAIEERNGELPGVIVDAEPVRNYVDGQLTSHLIGYVGEIDEERLKESSRSAQPYAAGDRVGQSGIEVEFQEELRGAAGEKRSEVDAAGREVSVLGLDPPKPGRNLILTIDLAFQREVHRILAERISEFEVASAVAVDPSNGHILAMAHLPTYDNQLFADGISDEEFARIVRDSDRPLLNGAISSAWPPGSCFKMVTAIGALQAGVVRPDTIIHCGGAIQLPGGSRLKCWAAHGPQDMVSALANSCDSYFYQLVGGEPNGSWDGIGADKLAEWARIFGLGRPTGVELPGETAGNVPTPAWKQKTVKEPWYRGDTYISAIGQGFYTATPIQMAMVAATVANGGTLYRPRMALEILDNQGRSVRQFEPEPVRTIPADQAHIQLVREGVRAGMLIGTTPNGARYTGTSWSSNIRDFTLAGKTGTSEYGTPGADGKLPTHGWFVYWAPHEAPRLAGAVFVRHGRGAQEAAVVASQMVRAYFGIV